MIYLSKYTHKDVSMSRIYSYEIHEGFYGPTEKTVAIRKTRKTGFSLTQPGRLQTYVICFILFLIAMGFNLYRIGDPSIWFDEALSVTRAQQPIGVLFRIIF